MNLPSVTVYLMVSSVTIIKFMGIVVIVVQCLRTGFCYKAHVILNSVTILSFSSECCDNRSGDVITVFEIVPFSFLLLLILIILYLVTKTFSNSWNENVLLYIF